MYDGFILFFVRGIIVIVECVGGYVEFLMSCKEWVNFGLFLCMMRFFDLWYCVVFIFWVIKEVLYYVVV